MALDPQEMEEGERMMPADSAFSLNETLKTIERRHSIRTFTEREVPDDLINILLQAANKAPSAHNQQPWRFIVIKIKKSRN